MLQQTQVVTALPYWERWMARFPTVEALAASEVDDVLTHWQGLGYYRRARLLREGAIFVAQHGLPRNAAEWLAVPSVGRYTAGAIASIALGEAAPLVDGNVERVFARLLGLRLSGPALHREVWQRAEALVDLTDPGAWNQALMELGATICRPVAPACDRCPISTTCVAYTTGVTAELPLAEPKVPTKALEHHRWIPVHQERLGLAQIAPGKWWAGMWDFPLTDTAEAPSSLAPYPAHRLGQFRHAVTNHRITAHVWRVECDKEPAGLTWVHPDEIAAYALPAPTKRSLTFLRN
jgi:A/G-specific adenine glycosylase